MENPPRFAEMTPELNLTLEPEIAIFQSVRQPRITALLTNTGNRPLTLVLPGDGSHHGLRTPVIEWTFTPGARLPGPESRGCANVAPLKSEEVFHLEPGETRDLGNRIEPPFLPAARRFHAAMTYVNEPDKPFLGVPLSPHDEAALALVRESHRCRVRSREIEFVFESDPVDAMERWFPEVIDALRARWTGGMTPPQLIALRDELQSRLRSTRLERGIEPGFFWAVSETVPGIRNRLWQDVPTITVRGLILALGRFRIAGAPGVETMEREWRGFRKEHGLDVDGAPLTSAPRRGSPSP